MSTLSLRKDRITQTEAKQRGFTIDTCCHPNVMYKGPRFSPEEWDYVLSEEEAELKGALEKAMRGCGSLLWLANNMHNYGTEMFREFLEKAINDAREGYAAASVFLR